MGTRVSEILRRLRLTDRCREDPDSDPTLLNKYIADGNEDAFYSLVRRHGPMVLGVCRRILGDPHTAEDAFQATFLVLARHASGIRRPAAVAAWLHGVARRAALRLHSAAVRCGADQLASDPPATAQFDPLTRVSARELLTALDEELQRLPERYRLAIVHCHLEGGTVDEAASRLATTPGAVRGWLARGRDRLAERLAARGFSLPAALLAVAAETVTELPVVAASGPSISPALAAAADAAVNSGSGYRLAWAVIATVGITAGIATAGVILTHRGQQVVAPIAGGPKPKNASQKESPDSLPLGALARLGTVRFKLASFPMSVRYSPDGKRLVVGDASGDVIVFDAGTGRIVRQFRSFDERNDAVPLYSPGGEHLAVVTRGGRVGIWHADKGDAPLWTLPPEDISVRRLVFSHDGKLLIGAEEGNESRVRLWDATNGHEQRSLPVHPKSVTGVAVSPDGKSLATSCEDGSVRLFDPKSAKQLRGFDHPNRKATAVAWAPDGKTLAWALTGSKGDKPIAEVILWGVVDDKEVARAESSGEAIRELVFTPDNQRVLGSDPDGTHVWDPKSGKAIRHLRNVGISTYPTLAVSPDSRTLATPGRKEIAFNDLGTGERSEPLYGPQQQVSAIAYAPNGNTVAVGSGDGRVYLYDPATGKLRRELIGDDNGVTGVAFAPDGKMLAGTAGHSKFVRLWDAASGELVRTLAHPDKEGGFATAVSYSPDGKRLAVTSYGIIRLYDPATGDHVRRFVKKDSGKVNAIAFSPDGKLLAAVGDDRSINLWETATGKEVAAWHLPHTTSIKSVAFSPDGKRLVWGAHGGWCQVWEIPSGRTLARIRGHEYGVESVAFTPDGKRVVTTGTFDTGPRVWETETGKELLGFRGHLDNPGAVAVAPDGKSAASAGNDSQVLIWDIDTPPAGIKPIGPPRVSSEVARLPKGVVRLGDAGSSGDHIAFSADGKRLAATVLVPGSEAGLVMWDMATRKPVWQIENDRERVFSLSWSADGTAVVTVGDFEGGVSLALWDAETGKELTRVRGLPSICDYALSPDSRTVAARRHAISTAMGERFGGEIDLFDVATGKRLRRLEGHDGDSVAWSPDGKLLVSGSARSSSVHTIRVWDPATGKVVREWDSGQGAATTLLFLPDGTLASGPGDGGSFRVWDVRTGKPLRETKGGGGAVQVALSADGKRAAWHGFSSPIVVQNAETGRRLGTYQAGPRWYGFALSPDGKTLATTGNGNLFLWPVPYRGGND